MNGWVSAWMKKNGQTIQATNDTIKHMGRENKQKSCVRLTETQRRSNRHSTQIKTSRQTGRPSKKFPAFHYKTRVYCKITMLWGLKCDDETALQTDSNVEMCVSSHYAIRRKHMQCNRREIKKEMQHICLAWLASCPSVRIDLLHIANATVYHTEIAHSVHCNVF